MHWTLVVQRTLIMFTPCWSGHIDAGETNMPNHREYKINCAQNFETHADPGILKAYLAISQLLTLSPLFGIQPIPLWGSEDWQRLRKCTYGLSSVISKYLMTLSPCNIFKHINSSSKCYAICNSIGQSCSQPKYQVIKIQVQNIQIELVASRFISYQIQHTVALSKNGMGEK